MPIIRNPFKKGAAFDDENIRPSGRTPAAEDGTVTAQSAALDIKQPTEYKLSGSSHKGLHSHFV